MFHLCGLQTPYDQDCVEKVTILGNSEVIKKIKLKENENKKNVKIKGTLVREFDHLYIFVDDE